MSCRTLKGRGGSLTTSKSNAVCGWVRSDRCLDIAGLRVGSRSIGLAVVSEIGADSGPENTKAASGSGGFGFEQNAT
jgi:hypothetical protein